MLKVIATLMLCGLYLIPTASAASGDRPTDDYALTALGRAVVIDVLANDIALGRPKGLRLVRQPVNGSAQVVAGEIRYLPAPGFKGRDRFSYFAAGIRSGGLATVTVDVGDAIVLQGKVTDSPIANAIVTASVNGNSFFAQADASGDYSLEIISLNEGMVTLGAHGVGAQYFVRLLSIVGGFNRLRIEAGGDAVLTRNENNQVQITQLSTALAYLLQEANEGAPIGDEEQLEVALESFDTFALPRMAGAIKLAVDGDYPLPIGTPDTVALISDILAFRQFLASVNADDPNALANASAATLTDPQIVSPSSAAALVGTRYQIVAGADGEVRVGTIFGEQLQLEADGTGSYINTISVIDIDVSWALDNGVARIVLNTPRVTEFFSFVNGIQVRTRTTLERLDASITIDGATSGRDLLGVVYHSRRSYPDNPDIPEVLVTGPSTFASYRDGIAEVPFLGSEFPSVRALDTHRPEIYPAGTSDPLFHAYALHRFDGDGTGVLLDDGQAFAWTLKGGRLSIDYADGEQTVAIRLFRDFRIGDGVLTLYRLPNGARKAFNALSSVRDGSLTFDAANLAFPWRSGFDISQPAYDVGADWGFYIALDGPAQTGSQINVGATGVQTLPLSWNLTNGTMVARRYRDNSGNVAVCTIGVNGCILLQERRWIPVSRSGNRIYVSEELLQRNAGGTLELISQRANFYQIEVPPAP